MKDSGFISLQNAIEKFETVFYVAELKQVANGFCSFI